MNSLGRKVLVASLGALILLAGGYGLVAMDLAKWNDASTYVMRDYRRAMLDAQLQAALTRAVGETASYALTGSHDYRDEAAEAVEQAQAAARLLRTIADAVPPGAEYGYHLRLLQRQERLLRLTEEAFQRATAALSAAGKGVGSADATDSLRWVYANEAEADALWRDIVAHHQAEQLENEQTLRDHSRRAQVVLLGGVLAMVLVLGLLIHYVRQHVVHPLTALARLTGSVAAGDLTGRADATGDDEVGQLQRSFNRMVEDLGQQRSELSALVESLARSRDAAEAANRAKSNFLANVSHEIRTPMNGVVVSLDLLHETAPDQGQRELVDTARSAARSLLRMLNDLLDFSRIEAGRLALESVGFELRPLVTRMVELHGRRAADKGLVMTCRVADDVPARLCGDPMRVGQVLLNLLDNAIKFTERGSIDVSVSLDTPPSGATESPQGEAPPSVRVRFRVTDSGVGVPAEAAQKLFEPFYQAEHSAACSHAGIGLGLGIARQLASRMGGEVGFESEVGKGSCFWFTARLLPEAPGGAAAATPSPPARPLPAGSSILLVEDHRDIREVMARTLRRRGLTVTTAENGRAALALAGQQTFDLILMDCRMPVMDGFEAMHAIRALGGERAKVPIVALTAYGLTGPKQHYLDAGFDDLVVKPYTLEDIDEALYRWLVLQRRDGVLPSDAEAAEVGLPAAPGPAAPRAG